MSDDKIRGFPPSHNGPRVVEYTPADAHVKDDYKRPLLASKHITLPVDSTARKDYPLFRGCLMYFPAALAGVARISKRGNDKHNPGKPMHHARGKSMDHGDCALRHLTDTADLLAAFERGADVTVEQIFEEVDQFAWRALAFAQEVHERFGAPLAPGATPKSTTPG